jgi:hypothetical protein
VNYRFFSEKEAQELIKENRPAFTAGTVHYHTSRSHDVASRRRYDPATLATRARGRGIQHAVAADHWTFSHPFPVYSDRGPHGAEPAFGLPGLTLAVADQGRERPVEQEFVVAADTDAKTFTRDLTNLMRDPSLDRLASLRDEKGWLIVLPHPFENYDKAFTLGPENAQAYVSHVAHILRTLRPVVELNACVAPGLNDLALHAARHFDLPIIANPDTHIGNFNAYTLAPGKRFDEWASNVNRGEGTYHVRADLGVRDVVRETTTRVLDLFGRDLTPADLAAYDLTTKNPIADAAIAAIKRYRTVPGVRTTAGIAALLTSPFCAFHHLGRQHRAAGLIKPHLERMIREETHPTVGTVPSRTVEHTSSLPHPLPVPRWNAA